MSWLNKLPNSIRSASGLEWVLWRKLPLILLVGTALPLLAALALHLGTDVQDATQLRWLQTMDYVVAGVVLFHWTAMATVAIGCVVVMLMKGPGYVADDPMEVSHSDQPRSSTEQTPLH
jgi:NO-binding membrane sensor protein with MHYT domain